MLGFLAAVVWKKKKNQIYWNQQTGNLHCVYWKQGYRGPAVRFTLDQLGKHNNSPSLFVFNFKHFQMIACCFHYFIQLLFLSAFTHGAS